MRIGKLTNEQLKSIVLSKLKIKPDVLIGAGVGEDCAAINFGGSACVLSTDPITGTGQNAGALAVHVSCNDIAASGTKPMALLVTLLVPPDKTPADVERVIAEIVETAASLDVDIVGGHTEVTDAVTRIVVSTTAIGKADPKKLVKSSGAQPGDALIMTGYAGMEGTLIIAAEQKNALAGVLSAGDIETAAGLLDRISVVKEGEAAGRLGATAMHDVTEGGIYGAAAELCEASGTGCEIDPDKIPVLDVTRKICAHFDISPFELIGSGSLLIAAADPDGMISALEQVGTHATVIGRITQRDLYVIRDGKREPMPQPDGDVLFSVKDQT